MHRSNSAPKRGPTVKKNVKPKTMVTSLKVNKRDVSKQSLRRKLNNDCKKLRVGPPMDLERCSFRTLSSIPLRFQRLLLGFVFARWYLIHPKQRSELRLLFATEAGSALCGWFAFLRALADADGHEPDGEPRCRLLTAFRSTSNIDFIHRI